ncbi:MAG: peptidoglycan-binding protein [Chthoniobacterales bacterium]
MPLRHFLVVAVILFPLVALEARPRGGRGRAAGSFDVNRETVRGGSIDASGSRIGRFGQSNVSVDGADGGSYDAERHRAGRFGSSSVDAQGPNGSSYDANAVRTGQVRAGNVNATGPAGGSVSAAGVRVAPYRSVPYRSNFVYLDGAYRPAAVRVNTIYVAPVGIYTGWRVVARPAYISYPAFATLPVEVSVQVELKARGYYGGPIDGDIGPVSKASISRYQSASGLAVTGDINRALLVSLGIVDA